MNKHTVHLLVAASVAVVLLFFMSKRSDAATWIDGNPNFERNFPVFKKVIKDEFPTHLKYSDYFAAQVEHESCASKKKCWNERSQLFSYEDLMSGKRREYGFGLGQITITKKFNNFEEIKKKDKRLRNWRFDQRFDSYRQLIGLFVLDGVCFNQVKFAQDLPNRYAMMFACYNGGFGHIVKDRKLCILKGKDHCNPDMWFGNIELDSVKSKKRKNGYGKSFFEINREYPRDIMFRQNKKYKPLLKDLINY